MTLTDNGCVYSWGDNYYGQCGNGTENDCCEPKLIDSLCNDFVIDICCGHSHSIVLTRTGYVYAFGCNRNGQCGTNSGITQHTVPVKIELSNVNAICCGMYHSIALTQSGIIFGWGLNDDRQLGIDCDNDKQLTPIQLSVVHIQQIMCGYSHTLLLSSDGDIYFCGEIKGGLKSRKQKKINKQKKFTKICAKIYSNLCVALSHDNKCYILGQSGDNAIRHLMITDFNSIDETFAFYEQITCKSIKISASKYKKKFLEKNALGMGAFSTVFKCECKEDNKLYAIKKVCFESDKRESVYKELNILSQLDSKFVVKYIASWVEHNYYIGSYSRENTQNISSDNLLYSQNSPHLLHIQMELCSLTLRDAIKTITNECLTKDSTLSLIGYYISSELFIELIECVQYLHQQKPAIIHRDLKPENVLITHFANNSRFIKLSDFGLSTFHSFADQSHTKYTGTKNYRAIEVNQTSKYTTKADIYSLGIILQEMFHFDNSAIRKNYFPVLLPKMNSLIKLTEVSLSFLPDKRPTCDELLTELQLLRLTNEDLDTDNEFMQIITKSTNSCSIDTNFIEYFIHYSYFFNTRPQTNKIQNPSKRQKT